MSEPQSPIDRAIAAAGSQSELARRVGCKPQLISAYARGIRRVSGEMAIRIARATKVVTVGDLRPDLADEQPVKAPVEAAA